MNEPTNERNGTKIAAGSSSCCFAPRARIVSLESLSKLYCGFVHLIVFTCFACIARLLNFSQLYTIFPSLSYRIAVYLRFECFSKRFSNFKLHMQTLNFWNLSNSVTHSPYLAVSPSLLLAAIHFRLQFRKYYIKIFLRRKHELHFHFHFFVSDCCFFLVLLLVACSVYVFCGVEVSTLVI